MERFIKIFHEYEHQEITNAFLNNDEYTAYKYTPRTSKLWDIGVKLWGESFIKREFELRYGYIPE